METTYNSQIETTYRKGNSRLWDICRKLYIEHRKTLLITICAYLGGCIVIGIWQGMSGSLAEDGSKVAYVFISGLICAVVASLTFNDLSTKEGRIAFLMTPGTALDKFLPRVLTTVIGMCILAFAGYYVWIMTDVLALGLKTSVWVPLTFYTPQLWSSQEEFLGFALLVSLFLFNESLYIFGAAAWPKKSFLKTTAIYIALQIALNMLALLIFRNFDFKYMSLDVELIGWIAVGIMLAIDAALIFAAYKNIERKQVI